MRPTGTNRAVGRDQDIFIAAHDSLAACQGDTVRIQVGRPRSNHGGRASGKQDHNQTRGRVIEVVTRVRYQFVGTYREKSNRGSVSVDGNQFERPIPVGDAGAKRAVIGDKVVIEMVRFPSGQDSGEAVVTEVLGARGEPGVDTQMILHEFMIRQEFSEEVLDDARLLHHALLRRTGAERAVEQRLVAHLERHGHFSPLRDPVDEEAVLASNITEASIVVRLPTGPVVNPGAKTARLAFVFGVAAFLLAILNVLPGMLVKTPATLTGPAHGVNAPHAEEENRQRKPDTGKHRRRIDREALAHAVRRRWRADAADALG